MLAKIEPIIENGKIFESRMGNFCLNNKNGREREREEYGSIKLSIEFSKELILTRGCKIHESRRNEIISFITVHTLVDRIKLSLCTFNIITTREEGKGEDEGKWNEWCFSL